jgi:dephospho-CoA kinase
MGVRRLLHVLAAADYTGWMLRIGLTGGIAAGKSLVSARLRELGAILIDADALARQVVEPGTAGLAAVVAAFGPGILLPDGALDRAALGTVVFADASQREVLNSIIHPLVRQAAADLTAAAGAGDVVVQDIPLLVETGQGAAFHLVVVVDAPDDVRRARLLAHRGMTAADAEARMAAQATREQRLAAADVVLSNDSTTEQVIAAVDALWHGRLVPFAANLAAGTFAPRSGPAVLVPSDGSWPAEGRRLAERIRAAAGAAAVAVDHIGSTAVPGLAAKDDLQLRVPAMADADAVSGALAEAGFPRCTGNEFDVVHSFGGDAAAGAEAWEKRFHRNADPGRPVNLHVRVDGAAGATVALAFRDWLRADAGVRRDYQAMKEGVAAGRAGDETTAGYAEAKEPWFVDTLPRLERWVRDTGWEPTAAAV